MVQILLNTVSGSMVSTEESKTSAQLENSKEGSEISKPETVTPVEYRIEAAGMYISVPSDMYVITRDTDKDDPVLAQNRTTKEEITKTFEENDIYLRAYPKDFSFVVNVTVNSTEDTQAIGDLSALDEGELQSIADKLLESDVYTGCSRNRYGGALFLTFTIEYDSSGTKIEGLFIIYNFIFIRFIIIFFYFEFFSKIHREFFIFF